MLNYQDCFGVFDDPVMVTTSASNRIHGDVNEDIVVEVTPDDEDAEVLVMQSGEVVIMSYREAAALRDSITHLLEAAEFE